MMFVVALLCLSLVVVVSGFQQVMPTRGMIQSRSFLATKMAVNNDAFARANREVRSVTATDRVVELRQPFGMDLDEDAQGNVFIKSINPKSFAEKSGKVFVGDRVAMVQAVFGEDMWSVRGAGLTRVVSCIKLRNNKPTKIVLEAATEAEEKKRRAIAYKEATEEEKKLQQIKADQLLAAIVDDDKDLLKKRKGLFGLW